MTFRANKSSRVHEQAAQGSGHVGLKSAQVNLLVRIKNRVGTAAL
jgi:hypothetical protein